MLDQLPKILYSLKKNKYKVETLAETLSGYKLFYVDLSELKLKFSDKTPVIWVSKEKAETISSEQLVDDIHSFSHLYSWEDRINFVLLDDNGEQFKRQTMGSYLQTIVIFDEKDQEYALYTLPSLRGMLEIICRQAPLSNLSPYTCGPSVVGNRFFGRQPEISRVLHHPDTNFAIISERRIGKTSLIHEIKRRLFEQTKDNSAFIYYDCSIIKSLPEFLHAIVGDVNVREQLSLYRTGNPSVQFMRILKNTSKSKNHKWTVFLDEFDGLIENLRKNKVYSINSVGKQRHSLEEIDLLSVIRASTNSGYCRYIYAGGQLLREEITHLESPLYQGIESIELKPFTLKETEEIVLGPMKSMGVRFDDEKNIVGKIQSNSHGHPLFVQYYCVQLIKLLDTQKQQNPERKLFVNQSTIDRIHNNPNFWAFIIDTINENLGDVEQAIIYAILQHYGLDRMREFPLSDIVEMILNEGVKFSVEEIEKNCQNLVSWAVLEQNERGYFFSTAIFPEALVKRYGNTKRLLQEKIEKLKK